MLKAIARNVCPPLLWNLLKATFKKQPDAPDPWESDQLFDGDGEKFMALAQKAKCYAEYGVGASTIWVAKNTKAHILGTDSSQEWINNVRQQIGKDRGTLTWVDLGPLADWGRPLSYAKRAQFQQYWQAPWQHDQKPDLLLVDGRFRVACFLHCLEVAAPGTTILFDDYVDRPHYHIIEEFLSPDWKGDRQACFTVPEQLDLEGISALKTRFELVMD